MIRGEYKIGLEGASKGLVMIWVLFIWMCSCSKRASNCMACAFFHVYI